MEDWDKLLAAFGLKLVNVIVGAVASFVALNFWRGLESRRERWSTFLGGWALAAWGAAPLRDGLDLKPALEVGLVLTLGLFGMAAAAEVIKLIRDTDWKGLVSRRIGGGDGGEK